MGLTFKTLFDHEKRLRSAEAQIRRLQKAMAVTQSDLDAIKQELVDEKAGFDAFKQSQSDKQAAVTGRRRRAEPLMNR